MTAEKYVYILINNLLYQQEKTTTTNKQKGIYDYEKTEI